MLAPLAHHLRAPVVALDQHAAHRARLDVAVEPLQVQELHARPATLAGSHADPAPAKVGPALAPLHELLAVLLARLAGVPGAGALGAELLGAGGAFHGHAALGVGGGWVADVADGLTVCRGAPRPIRVQ